MAIKIKHINPSLNEFSTKDLVVNVEEGSLFFKSNIKKNHSDLSYKERVSFIQNLHNQKKIVESNPISYFLDSFF